VNLHVPESAGTFTAVVSSSAMMLLLDCDYCSLQHNTCPRCRHQRNCEKLFKRISRKVKRLNT